MTTWIKLTPEQAHHSWRIPQDVAAKESNTFWGFKTVPFTYPDFDGPWSMLAFLSDDTKMSKVIFHIRTLDYQSLEGPGDYNPLESTLGNYLSLTEDEVASTADLLIQFSARLQPISNLPERQFVEILRSDLYLLGLKPHIFPTTKQLFFQQKTSYSKESEVGPISLVYLSRQIGKVRPSLFFKLMHFQHDPTQAPSSAPFDFSLGKITLDQNAMKELALLLRKQLI